MMAVDLRMKCYRWFELTLEPGLSGKRHAIYRRHFGSALPNHSDAAAQSREVAKLTIDNHRVVELRPSFAGATRAATQTARTKRSAIADDGHDPPAKAQHDLSFLHRRCGLTFSVCETQLPANSHRMHGSVFKMFKPPPGPRYVSETSQDFVQNF
jgi:hypothetical protein